MNAKNNSALDGVRAVAICLVLLYHAGAPLMGFAWIGVDIFFVLSGFLITSLLIKEHTTTGTISIRNFMARRFLRIMPAYWLYAALITVLMFAGFGETVGKEDAPPNWLIASIWGYFNNFLPRGGFWTHDYLVHHLWSLSLEEQFYLVWPFIFLFSLRIGQALFISMVLCVAMFSFYYLQDAGKEHFLLHTRGIGLGLGCLAAIIISDERYRPVCTQWLASRPVTLAIYAVNFAGVLILALVTFNSMGNTSRIDRDILPLLDIGFALWVASVWLNPGAILNRWLAWKPAVFIGRISYGIYLYHMFVWFLVWHVFLSSINNWPAFPKYGLRLAVYVALTVGLAAFSYHVLEKPLLNLKSRFRAHSPAGRSGHEIA